MKKKIMAGLLLLLMALVLCGCGEKEAPAPVSPASAYYEMIDSDYSLGVAEALSAFGTNYDLGFRTSGSAGELAAGEFLENEMQAIGLQNVVKEVIPVDTWAFSKATLVYEDQMAQTQAAILASYATQWTSGVEDLQLIYAGRGTEAAFAGVDAKGKLALIEIDHTADLPINWPAYQAKLAGAKGVIAIHTGGYAQYDENTLGIQDIRGPSDAPAFTISKRDGEILKGLVLDSEEKSVWVKFTADSQVFRDGTAGVIVGEIPGKSEDVLYIISHYDGYFRAFQDDAAGVGAMLGIAKAIVDSGYEPEKTIRFIAHPSEEWGLCDSHYDGAIGAYRTIEKHPEWVHNAFALINLDGGVMSNQAEGVLVSSSWELSNFALDIGETVEGPFSDFAADCPPRSFTGGFPYFQTGIPVLGSGYSGTEAERHEVYHTNMDTADYFYNPEALTYTMALYGTYLLELDKAPVIPLDYVAYFDGLRDSVALEDSETAAALTDAIDEASDAAHYLTAKIEETDWAQEDAAGFNRELRKLCQYGQENFVSLDWNDEVIFAQERYQSNVAAITAAIEALRKGDGKAALEECLYRVDMNMAASAFSKETYEYFSQQVLGPEAKNAWGTGYIKDNENLYDIIRSIQVKLLEEGVVDYFDEAEALSQSLIRQQELLDKTVVQMTKDVARMTEMIDKLAE